MDFFLCGLDKLWISHHQTQNIIPLHCCSFNQSKKFKRSRCQPKWNGFAGQTRKKIYSPSGFEINFALCAIMANPPEQRSRNKQLGGGKSQTSRGDFSLVALFCRKSFCTKKCEYRGRKATHSIKFALFCCGFLPSSWPLLVLWSGCFVSEDELLHEVAKAVPAWMITFKFTVSSYFSAVQLRWHSLPNKCNFVNFFLLLFAFFTFVLLSYINFQKVFWFPPRGFNCVMHWPFLH